MPPTSAVGSIMFLCSPSVRPSVCALFPRCLWHALIDLHHGAVSSASWDTNELSRFGVKRSKVECVEFSLLQTRIFISTCVIILIGLEPVVMKVAPLTYC